MKRTFIFLVTDDINEDTLARLVDGCREYSVSYRATSTDNSYERVQVFTDETTMHHIAYRAGFSGDRLRNVMPAAKKRGDAAIGRAESRLNTLRRNAAEVGYFLPRITIRRMASELQHAGHDVAVEACPDVDLYHVRVSGNVIFSGSGERVAAFLLGMQSVATGEAGAPHMGISPIDDEQFLKNLSRPQMPGGTKRSKRSA